MRALHLLFQLHQPYSLKAPEEGEHEYFGGGADFREANQKYYQPFFALLERNTQRYAGLKVSLSVSGTWLDQAELYEPDLVRRLQKLVDLKQVELVAMPYYYSLAAFYDKEEFSEQVAEYRRKFEGKFGTALKVLALPELMYHDRLAKWAEKNGFCGALAGDGAGVLDFRSAGKVYDAVGCEDFRVLFEDGRLSRALMRGGDLVLAETMKTSGTDSEVADVALAGEFGGDGVADEPAGHVATRKKATAAEFVRSRAGTTRSVSADVKMVKKRDLGSGKKIYSARKFQKELELACLRGNLVSLSLDVRMFGAHREKGVVAFFDELFANWLKVPGNKFLTASEALCEFQPTAEISVKSTVETVGYGDAGAEGLDRSDDTAGETGLARAEDVQYAVSKSFAMKEQKTLEQRLYKLREDVLKTKNEDLRRVFQKLTGLDYVRPDGIADFEKVVTDFEEWVKELMPKPKQLRAENSGAQSEDAETGAANLTATRAVTGDEEPEPEDDYTVEVHRILKKAEERPVRPEDFELESGPEGFEVEDEEELEDGDIEDEDFGEGDFEAEIADDGETAGDEESTANEEEMMDAFDAAEAEVQVIAQRMKRSRQAMERELDALVEAEVVAVGDALGAKQDDAERSGTKAASAKRKKIRHKIVLD